MGQGSSPPRGGGEFSGSHGSVQQPPRNLYGRYAPDDLGPDADPSSVLVNVRNNLENDYRERHDEGGRR